MKATEQIREDLNKYDINENERNKYSMKVMSAIKALNPIPFEELEFEAMDFHALGDVIQKYDVSIDQLYAIAGRIPVENLEVTAKNGAQTVRKALMMHDQAINGHLLDTLLQQVEERSSNFYQAHKELIDAHDSKYFAKYQVMRRGGVKLAQDALALKVMQKEDLENAIGWNIISADEIELSNLESNPELQDVEIIDYSTDKKVKLYQHLKGRQQERIKTDEHKRDDLQKDSQEHQQGYVGPNAENLGTYFEGTETIEELLSDIGPENIEEVKTILSDRIKDAQKNGNPLAAFDIMCSVMAEYMNSQGYRNHEIEEIYKACQEAYYGHEITTHEQQSALDMFEIPFAFLEAHPVSAKVAMSQLHGQQQSEKERATKGVTLDEIFKLPCNQLAEKRNALHKIFPEQGQFKGDTFAQWVDEFLDLVCNIFYSHKAVGKGYQNFATNHKGEEFTQTDLEAKVAAFGDNPRASQLMDALNTIAKPSQKEQIGRS